MIDKETLAGRLYETYCVAVGGVAFNGDTLPNWMSFRSDPAKIKQVDAWLKVAEESIRMLVEAEQPA